MIEAKLDAFRKQQENITKVGFAIQHTDIPKYLAEAALGKRYYLVLVDADDYDAQKDTADTQSLSRQLVDALRLRNF